MEAGAFQKLKPFCVEVAQSPNLKNLCQLQNALDSVDKEAFHADNILRYVLFPLKMTIERIKYTNEKLLIKTLECACSLFTHSSVKSGELLLEVFDLCCMLLSSKKEAIGREMLAVISEEVKIKITVLLNVVLQNASKDAILCLFSRTALPRLGHAISLFLVLSELEKDRELRLESIKCLQHLSCKYRHMTSGESQHISDVYCSFIPGITLTFSRILMDTSNMGQNIFISVAEALKDIITLVMADSKFHFLKQSISRENVAQKLKSLSKFQVTDKEAERPKRSDVKNLIVERDKSWMESTAKNLSVLINRVTPRLAYHSSAKVRLSAISLAKSLLNECSISMAISAPSLIEILAGMQHDDYYDVSQEAINAIEECRLVFQQGERSLHAAIEEKLYEKLLSLPRIMRSSNDDQKVHVLNVLLGLFNLLGHKLADILNSVSLLEKLLKSFIQALELDVSDVKIVEEKNPASSEDMIDRNVYELSDCSIAPHRFKHFKDIRVFRTIKSICFCIGQFADLNVVIDFLLEMFLSSSRHRKEVALFLNEILRSCIDVHSREKTDNPPVNRRQITDVVSQIVSVYLRDEFWYLPTTNVSDVSGLTKDFLENQLTLLKTREETEQLSYWEKGIPIEQINSNIQLICLMIDGISICSGIPNFNVFLIKVLYPLLEKLGNENAMIAETSLNSLSVISKNCCGGSTSRGSDGATFERPANDASIADLISHNADYLVNSISMSFRHLTLLSSAPCVLSVMLTYSNKEILPLVADVIQDVFNCLDLYQEEIAFSLMQVLKSLASAVSTWYGEVCNNMENEEKTQQDFNHVITPLEFGVFVSDYCRLKVEALGGVESDEETIQDVDGDEERHNNIENKEQDIDEAKNIPTHFKVVLTSLEKCQHYLPSKDVRLKLLTIDVIELCIQALKQRQHDLLPAVHKVWPSVLERIRDSNHVVVIRTFELITKMIDSTGDFLGQRVKKDVFPLAFGYLTKHCNTSLKGGPMYRFSPTCKQQTQLLILIASAIEKLGLSNEILWKTGVVCSGYLDCRQPMLLQIEASNLFKNMRNVDWGMTWLILTSLYSPQILTAPSSCFKDIALNEATTERNSFTYNVRKILYTDNVFI